MKRLENIDQLQWELDAWLRHYANWSANPLVGSEMKRRAQALETAAQAVFDAFGQPDSTERLEDSDA